MPTFTIPTPPDFSFPLCMEFLRRSPSEVLHQCDSSGVTKALMIGGKPAIFRVTEEGGKLVVSVLHGKISDEGTTQIINYVRNWFDLTTDLKPFYRMAGKDELLKPLVKKYRGYRIVGQPDLFESLVWAVLGQQINLTFAYTLKGRFVSAFGQRFERDGISHYIFPEPAVVAAMKPGQLHDLQFSRQKAAYTIGIARAFLDGELSTEKLSGLPFDAAKTELMKIKGIGNWTANYALMKTFHCPDAFPLEDAGLHNAIRRLLNLKAKPSIERVKKIFKKYKGWEAYATLYFWKSL